MDSRPEAEQNRDTTMSFDMETTPVNESEQTPVTHEEHHPHGVSMSALGRSDQHRHLENDQICLEARNLNLFYGDKQALFDISMQIPKHRATAFIGPSGCGKSTLLRTLNRMYSLYPGQRAEGQINSSDA